MCSKSWGFENQTGESNRQVVWQRLVALSGKAQAIESGEIRIGLVCVNDRINDPIFSVRKGDRFVAINCFKFPVDWFQDMASKAGFENGEPIFDHQKRMVIQPLHA